MSISYTLNYRLHKRDFDDSSWHDSVNGNFDDLDNILNSIIGFVAASVWKNSTSFTASQKAIDSTTGTIYLCNVTHTSAASPTTFATDRSNNPGYWSIYTNPVNAMGTWTTATAYRENTWVVNGYQYALCLVDHTSGTFATDVAANKWVIVLDLTTALAGVLALGQAFNFTDISGNTSAVAGTSYRTTATLTLTLPTMSANETIIVGRDSSSGNATIGRNAQTIDGNAADFVMDLDKDIILFVCSSAGVIKTRKIGTLPT